MKNLYETTVFCVAQIQDREQCFWTSFHWIQIWKSHHLDPTIDVTPMDQIFNHLLDDPPNPEHNLMSIYFIVSYHQRFQKTLVICFSSRWIGVRCNPDLAGRVTKLLAKNYHLFITKLYPILVEIRPLDGILEHKCFLDCPLGTVIYQVIYCIQNLYCIPPYFIKYQQLSN